MEIAFILAHKENNAVVLFGTLKVQSFVLCAAFLKNRAQKWGVAYIFGDAEHFERRFQLSNLIFVHTCTIVHKHTCAQHIHVRMFTHFQSVMHALPYAQT